MVAGNDAAFAVSATVNAAMTPVTAGKIAVDIKYNGMEIGKEAGGPLLTPSPHPCSCLTLAHLRGGGLESGWGLGGYRHTHNNGFSSCAENLRVVEIQSGGVEWPLRHGVVDDGVRGPWHWNVAVCDTTACPTPGDAGSPISIKYTKTIPAFIPPGAYTIEFKAADQAGAALFCVAVDFSVGIEAGLEGAIGEGAESVEGTGEQGAAAAAAVAAAALNAAAKRAGEVTGEVMQLGGWKNILVLHALKAKQSLKMDAIQALRAAQK